jgi:hypothetical protein
LGTGNSALSTVAKNSATPISSMHSTASTSILTTSTTTPLGRPQEAHHHHHHHHHVDAQAQNVCHVH